MGKIMTGIGFAAGYVLGAKAGRERYQQIVRSAEDLANRPQVQQATGKIKSAVSDRLPGGQADTASSGPGGGPATVETDLDLRSRDILSTQTSGFAGGGPVTQPPGAGL